MLVNVFLGVSSQYDYLIKTNYLQPIVIHKHEYHGSQIQLSE